MRAATGDGKRAILGECRDGQLGANYSMHPQSATAGWLHSRAQGSRVVTGCDGDPWLGPPECLIDIDKRRAQARPRPLARSRRMPDDADRIKIRPRPPIPCQYKCVATSSCALYAALIISIIIVH